MPRSPSVDGTTISNPMAISYVFNNYFSSVANKAILKISLLHKHFSDYLKNRSNFTWHLRVVSTTYLLLCFLSLKQGTYETRKNVFYFTS